MVQKGMVVIVIGLCVSLGFVYPALVVAQNEKGAPEFPFPEAPVVDCNLVGNDELAQCGATESDCSNLYDDDHDGKIDCADDDCSHVLNCIDVIFDQEEGP